RRSYGKMTNPEVSEDGDVLFGSLVQVDADKNPIEGGITKDSTLRIDLAEDKAIRKSLVGLKKDDNLVLDLRKGFGAAAAARTLGVEADAVEAMENTTFSFTVKNINRLEPADLNEEFFNKVFGEGVVTDEKGFEEQVRQEVESMLAQNSTQKLQNDLYLAGMDTAIELPEEFLKRWLKATNPEIKDEELEEGFADFLKNLKWTLIENQIIRANNLEVKYDEVLDLAKQRIAVQFRMYGQGQMPEPSEEELHRYAMQLLQDKEQANRLFEEVKSLKVF